jgi:hypothetical protein
MDTVHSVDAVHGGDVGRTMSEKAIQASAEKLMRLFGFEVYHLSQARASKQTPGLPDDIFIGHGQIIFYECKTETGKRSKAQERFRDLVLSSGGTCICGGLPIVEATLVGLGLARRVPGGIEGLRHSENVRKGA